MIVVIGGGPAGLLFTLYAKHMGHTVVCFSTTDSWRCTYSMWFDELKDSWFYKNGYISIKKMYNKVEVIFPDKKHVFNKKYVLLDNVETHKRVMDSISDNVRLEKVTRVWKQGDQYLVNNIECNIVIDATGINSKLQKYINLGSETCYQAFYGERRSIEHNYDMDTAILMDFSKTFDPPGFLYVLPLSENSVFYEETLLASYRDVDLCERLVSRIGSANSVDFIEKGKLPMGHKLPYNSDIPAIGQSRGMSNPASGYMMTYLMKKIENSFDKFVERQEILDPGEKVNFYIYQMGIYCFTQLSQNELNSFLGVFFSINEEDWYKYLTRNASFWGMIIILLKIFALLSNRMRVRIIVLAIKYLIVFLRSLFPLLWDWLFIKSQSNLAPDIIVGIPPPG